MTMQTERDLISMCLALIVDGLESLSTVERKLVKVTQASVSSVGRREADAVRKAILRGADPLGDAFSAIRSPQDRRSAGAVYTPHAIVRSMMTWLSNQGKPARIVDQARGQDASSWPQARLFLTLTWSP